MKSKLFIKFLFLMLATSLSVVVLMVVGMQFFVYRNFSDYVVQQELDSLDGLAATLSKQYSKSNSWKDFKEDPRQWHDMLNSYFPAGATHLPPPPEHIPARRASDNSGNIEPNPGMTPRPENRHENDPERDSVMRGPDRLPGRRPRLMELSEMGRRLSLFDSDKHVIIGNPAIPEQTFRAIEIDGQVVGWLGLINEPHKLNPTDMSFLKRQSLAFYIIGAIVLMMAVGISVIFSRHLTAPVKRIAEGTRAVRNRRFSTRITVASNDELGQLAEDFNAMAWTLQDHENVRRQWLTDIAHELRTPLAVLRGEVEALQDGIRKMSPQAVDSLHAEIMVLSKIVDDLSLIAKTESGIIEMQPVSVELATVLLTSIARYKTRFEGCGLDLREKIKTDGLHTMGDADKLSQVFGNIFENIVRYSSSPGTIEVSAEAENDQIEIMIEDTGPGVPETSLPRLFDRLYRTDSARSRETGGSGLGLSICKSIIEAHQGKIWAENSVSGGLRIIIRLPLTKQ